MKTYNIPLFFRLVIFSFVGWSLLRVAYRYWQFHPTPFSVTLSGWGIFGFVIGLAAGSSFFLGIWFSFFQWLALRRYIKSIWIWMLLQLFAWIIVGAIHTALIFPFVRLFPDDVLRTGVRALIEALMISLSIASIQHVMLRKTTSVSPWWAIFPMIGIFTGVLLERLNQNFVFTDPLYATLLSSAIVAIVASLPSLLVDQRPTLLAEIK